MTKLTLTARLVLLLMLPLLGVIGFGLNGAWDKWSDRHHYAQLRISSDGLAKLGDVIHELQRERGRAAVFAGRRGEKFAAELPEQQKATNAALAKFDALRRDLQGVELGADFETALKRALTALDQLPGRRKAISEFAITATESTAYFTSTIAELLDVVILLSNRASDVNVARGIACYTNFVEIKEQVGIERAVLSGVFSADKFAGDAFARLNQAIAAQNTFQRIFLQFATDAQKQAVADIVRGPAVEQAAAMRKTALERSTSGGFGVDSSAWYDAITAKIDLMKQVEDRLAAHYTAAVEERGTHARRSFLIYTSATVVILLFTAIFGAWAVRSISGPLKHIIGELRATAAQTASAAAQVSASSQSLAAGANDQASGLEETSSALAEMAATSKRNAQNAQQAKEFSHQTRASADAGARHVDEMRQAMDAIKASSDGISKIIKTIDEIAFQTNILALNAAVEAARAGDAGMGFAVVADEVRSLAQRSAQSAKETAEKIEDAIRRSEHGVQISTCVAQALGDILDKARRVDALVADIADASTQQNQGAEQVSSSVGRLDRITQANASNAEETASAAEELNAQTGALHDAVGALAQLVGGAHSATIQLPAVEDAAPARLAPARRAKAVSGAHSSPSHSLRPAISLKPVRQMTEVVSNV